MTLPQASGGGAARPMVMALFVSTCLLSLVSWYTTWQGMALYLNQWFAFLASLGVQSALVLVAWLIGFTNSRRALLTAVYVITGFVSVAFSYVSLYTWFSARERPAIVQRGLYDTIADTSGKAGQILSSSIAEARLHVAALEEMAAAERAHGFIARAQDADPYLARIRASVAQEAQSLGEAYKEGSGAGLRYTAFDRHAKLARESLDQLVRAERALAAMRAQLKPGDSSESQIRRFREAYDAIPWPLAAEHLHQARLEPPPAPSLAAHLDQTASGQEELLLAFTELVTAPTGRHVFAFLLAAFIDVIVFLLAFASGPHFAGSPEQRWPAASAALEGLDPHLFTRQFLRKLEPDASGMARVSLDPLTPGEKQLCILLAARGMATLVEDGPARAYLIDERFHAALIESLASPSMPLRAARFAASPQGS